MTTVGYGDIASSSMHEMVFRIFCMIFGVVLFSVLSSSVLESLISDKFNDETVQIRQERVALMSVKYNF